MNLNIQWTDCATKKYQRAETFTIDNYRLDVEELPIVSMSQEAKWSIRNLKTGETVIEGTQSTTMVITLMRPDFDAFERAKARAEKELKLILDQILTEAIEREILDAD